MIGEPQDGFHAGQFPDTVASLESGEERWPVKTLPIESKRLRTHVGYSFRGILMGEERAPMPMMCAYEPEHEFGIIGFDESPVCPRQSYR